MAVFDSAGDLILKKRNTKESQYQLKEEYENQKASIRALNFRFLSGNLRTQVQWKSSTGIEYEGGWVTKGIHT